MCDDDEFDTDDDGCMEPGFYINGRSVSFEEFTKGKKLLHDEKGIVIGWMEAQADAPMNDDAAYMKGHVAFRKMIHEGLLRITEAPAPLDPYTRPLPKL